MEVWMADKAYIITYPINAGKMLNLVLSHHTPEKVRATQPNSSIEEFRNTYNDYGPRIRRIVEMVPNTVQGPAPLNFP